MPNRFYVVDFCKHKALSKIDKTVDLQTPFNNPANAIVGGASLGCNVPVSHTSGNTGFVLSRVNHNTGVLTSTNLASVDSSLITNPGETAWMQGIKTSLLAGSVGYDYPVSAITRDYHVSISSIEWMRDINGIQLSPDLPVVPRIRFGSQLGIKRTAIVGSNQEFLIQNKVKALHHTKHYAQIASVPVESDPLGLIYDTGQAVYTWPVLADTADVKNAGLPNFYSVGAFPDLIFVDIHVRIWCVWPALIGHGPVTYTPNSGSDSNGPAQDRRYTIVPLDDITTPNYGGSIAGTFNLTPSRRGIHFYGHIDNPDIPVEVHINGVDILPSFGGASIPGPQKLDYLGGGNPVFIPPTTQFTEWAVIDSRSVGSFHIVLINPTLPPSDPSYSFDLGTLVFSTSPVPGLLYEGLVYVQQHA